jgi:ATP adenylyltransferase
MRSFEPGALWRLTLERTERALRSGALQCLPTRIEWKEQGRVNFLIHVLENIEQKRRAGRVQKKSGVNPFLPYEEELFVADVTDTHVCLLNKFNVCEHHLLIVTRAYEEQDELLNARDFEAMWLCMAEFEGLAFYNGGTVAGASQPHKHLQQVPVPLGKGAYRTPIDPLVELARYDGALGTVPSLPFRHCVARVEADAYRKPRRAAEDTLALYHELLRVYGLEQQPGSYNLLVTRDWMLLIPRSKEHFESISINALGFAGSLFVRNLEELELVYRTGPMAILEHVSFRTNGLLPPDLPS